MEGSVVVKFKALLRHSHGGFEENHENGLMTARLWAEISIRDFLNTDLL
jgi:hypothetical protein